MKQYHATVVTTNTIQDLGLVTIEELLDDNLNKKNEDEILITNVHIRAVGDYHLKAELKSENDKVLQTYFLRLCNDDMKQG